MRKKPVTVSIPCLALLIIVVAPLLLSLVPLPSSSLRRAEAAPPTAISPTGGTGSPASLGTTITSGTSTSPTNLCVANCVITGGTRAGTNLFQSFGLFSIGSGDTATFQNTRINGVFPLTTNILSRVTDGQPSQIFGTLRTADFGNANLFLMNPAGIVFGPNATLNVGGSVTFTTANNIKLTSGWLFDKTSDPNANVLLSSAPIASFGFLGPTVEPITVHGMTVQGSMPTDPDTGVPLGQKVSLVGGDITFASYSDPTTPNAPSTPSVITAPGRQIQITSVAGAGEVAADTLTPSVNMALGTVTLNPGTVLSTIGASTFGDGSGGAVSIRGGQFVATNATINTSPADGSFGSGGAVTVDVTGSATFTDSIIQTKPADFSFGGAGGAVSITANDSLTMTNTTIDTSTFFAGGDSGSVALTTNGFLSITNSTIRTASDSSGNAGSVTVTGKDVTLDGSVISAYVTGDQGLGLDMVRSGTVTATATNTMTLSGSTISATASGTLADASPVTIAGKAVNLSTGTVDASMTSDIESPGNGGTIEIRGNNVTLTQFQLFSLNAGLIASAGRGGKIRVVGTDGIQSADNIQLTASQVNANATAGGGGGTIEFQTKALTMSNTQVSALTFGPGPGGSITVQGAENVTLESNSLMDTSAVFSPFQGPFGSAGPMLIETQQLTIQGGSVLRAADLPLSRGDAGSITMRGSNGPAQSILINGAGTGIFTDAQGTGAGGNITLTANTVTLQNGGTISAATSGTATSAVGGDIRLTASQSVTMKNGSTISVSSTGLGDAGNISINAGQVFRMTDSTVQAQANQASGGNIDIRATDLIRLANSRISTSVLGGAGGGGNIFIDPNLVILQNSQILAQAVQGAGGNITVFTPLFLADSSSLVSASSQFGLNGTVTIQSPTSNLSRSLGTLASKPRQAQNLLTQRCAALANGQSSSFVVAGREQLPADPGGWLSSPVAFASLGESLDTGDTLASIPTVMTTVAHDTDRVSLRRLTPAGFLIANFAESEATGCHS